MQQLRLVPHHCFSTRVPMSSHPLCSWIGHDIQRQLSPIQGLVSICQRKKTNHRKEQRKFRVFVFKHPMSRRRRVQWTLRIHRPHQQAPLRFSFPRYFLPQSDYIFFLNSMGNVWSSPSSIYPLKNKILSIIFSPLHPQDLRPKICSYHRTT